MGVGDDLADARVRALAEEAGREAVRAVACTFNSQLTDTAVERAAISESNRKLQKGDSLLTHRRTKGAGRGTKLRSAVLLCSLSAGIAWLYIAAIIAG